MSLAHMRDLRRVCTIRIRRDLQAGDVIGDGQRAQALIVVANELMRFLAATAWIPT